jgi:hypothetical protein
VAKVHHCTLAALAWRAFGDGQAQAQAQATPVIALLLECARQVAEQQRGALSQEQEQGNWALRLLRRLSPASWLHSADIMVGRKRLLRDNRDSLRMAAPFLLWGGLVVRATACTLHHRPAALSAP